MTDNNFHKLPLNESFERVAKVAKERDAFSEQMAANEREALRESWNTCLGADVSDWAHDNVNDILNLIDQQAAEIESLRDYICASPSTAIDTQDGNLVSALERIAQIDSDGFESHTPQAMVSIARKALATVDNDPPCTDCNDTGYNPNTERYCTCDAAL